MGLDLDLRKHISDKMGIYRLLYFANNLHLQSPPSPVKPDSVDVLAPVLLRYKAAHSAGAILHVAFTTVSEYFWLLRAACESLSALGPRAVLYLAAAVSDFYVPKDRVVSTLIQGKISR